MGNIAHPTGRRRAGSFHRHHFLRRIWSPSRTSLRRVTSEGRWTHLVISPRSLPASRFFTTTFSAGSVQPATVMSSIPTTAISVVKGRGGRRPGVVSIASDNSSIPGTRSATAGRSAFQSKTAPSPSRKADRV